MNCELPSYPQAPPTFFKTRPLPNGTLTYFSFCLSYWEGLFRIYKGIGHVQWGPIWVNVLKIISNYGKTVYSAFYKQYSRI